MSRNIKLFSFVFVFVFVAAAFLFVVCPTQDAQSGSSSISDTVDTVQDAVDNANAALEDSVVGEALEEFDNARN